MVTKYKNLIQVRRLQGIGIKGKISKLPKIERISMVKEL